MIFLPTEDLSYKTIGNKMTECGFNDSLFMERIREETMKYTSLYGSPPGVEIFILVHEYGRRLKKKQLFESYLELIL